MTAATTSVRIAPMRPGQALSWAAVMPFSDRRPYAAGVVEHSVYVHSEARSLHPRPKDRPAAAG